MVAKIRYFAKYRNMNQIFKALSDPTRRRVLQLLHERSMTAGELTDRFDRSPSTMSRHFALLREAGLIEADKQGTTITYRLRLSVLQDALLGFAEVFDIGVEPDSAADAAREGVRHAT